MGWGVSFKADIYLSRIKKEDVDDKILEYESNIQNTKETILMYCSSNIKDLVPDDWKDEPISFIKNSVDLLWQDLMEDKQILTNLYHYKNNFIEETVEE